MGEGRYKVILSAQSIRDLGEIVRFVAADDAPAAERFGNRLISETEALGLHPLAGRVVPEFDDVLIREQIHRAYRIVYRVDGLRKVIVVSRFWHSARGAPELPLHDE